MAREPPAGRCAVDGDARAILTGERVALNFLQRLSGIATATARCVDGRGRKRREVLDTRKTTPGLRELEKAAVAAGGGRTTAWPLRRDPRQGEPHRARGRDRRGRPARASSARPTGMRSRSSARPSPRSRGTRGRRDALLLDNMAVDEMREARRARGRERAGGVSAASRPPRSGASRGRARLRVSGRAHALRAGPGPVHVGRASRGACEATPHDSMQALAAPADDRGHRRLHDEVRALAPSATP